MLLSLAYCPPIEYIALIARDMVLRPEAVVPSEVTIDLCESFTKQTYRNRCLVLGPSGVQTLQVPVVHRRGIPISEAEVDYSTPWVAKTLKTVDTAYYSSPWYEYYRDDYAAILESRPGRLAALDIALLKFFLGRTGVSADIAYTDTYIPAGQVPDDFRGAVHPKRPNTILADMGLGKPYSQVFGPGFTPGLSVMDLLFNEGPDSILFLKGL